MFLGKHLFNLDLKTMIFKLNTEAGSLFHSSTVLILKNALCTSAFHLQPFNFMEFSPVTFM